MLLSFRPAAAQTVDYDANDNRLIKIDSLEKLNAIRHDLDGDGSSANAVYTAAFPTPAADQCPTSCQGYELTRDLDFDTDGDGSTWTETGGVYTGDSDDAYDNSDDGWLPIGTWSAPYATRFHGNGHVIANLFINRASNITDQGLFGSLSGAARVEFIGLENANVISGTDVGILAGDVRGTVYAAYSTGRVDANQRGGGLFGDISGGDVYASWSSATVSAGSGRAGGLAGHLRGNLGTITASYATGAVSGGADRGGLVGYMDEATITASYSTGAGGSGGLVGTRIGLNDTFPDSYYDRQTSGQSDTGKGEPKTTRELKTPTEYGDGIYANWNVNVDGVDGADDPWDFGTNRHYPALKIDFDGDGTATCREFGPQRCYREPGPPPYNWRADHPEIYQNARTGIMASCAVRTTGTGDAAVTTSTLTFDLAEYTRPITLALSLWDRTHFRSLQSLGLNMPALQREGQTATAEVVTDPARTRFRLDGPYGLNLVLGYADCHTDDS